MPLLALLVLSVRFAGVAWEHIGGEPIPAYGYVAIVGGVFVSLFVGGGLMALVFYKSRHGYDDLSGGDTVTVHNRSSLWVKSAHVQCKTSCPVYTRKRTCAVH